MLHSNKLSILLNFGGVPCDMSLQDSDAETVGIILFSSHFASYAMLTKGQLLSFVWPSNTECKRSGIIFFLNLFLGEWD